MEGGFNAVFIEKLNQAAIFHSSVVIAEGNTAFLSALPESCFYEFHILLL
jgi:hypothetical protein